MALEGTIVCFVGTANLNVLLSLEIVWHKTFSSYFWYLDLNRFKDYKVLSSDKRKKKIGMKGRRKGESEGGQKERECTMRGMIP